MILHASFSISEIWGSLVRRLLKASIYLSSFPSIPLVPLADLNLDDAILTDLGSPDEFTGDQRSKYVMGLREVLTQMRVKNTRDFETIASEITQHRARFLGDKSKILLLEGVTL